MTQPKLHRCDESCYCHGKPMIYSPATGEHACQEPTCKNYHGTKLSNPDWAQKYLSGEWLD